MNEAWRGLSSGPRSARPQPCRCLWRGFSQITYTLPRRRTILQCSQIRLTLDRIFIGLPTLFPSIARPKPEAAPAWGRLVPNPNPVLRPNWANIQIAPRFRKTGIVRAMSRLPTDVPRGRPRRGPSPVGSAGRSRPVAPRPTVPDSSLPAASGRDRGSVFEVRQDAGALRGHRDGMFEVGAGASVLGL